MSVALYWAAVYLFVVFLFVLPYLIAGAVLIGLDRLFGLEGMTEYSKRAIARGLLYGAAYSVATVTAYQIALFQYPDDTVRNYFQFVYAVFQLICVFDIVTG